LPNGGDHGGQDGQDVVYSFRPEHLTLGPAGNGIAANILVVEPTGAGTHLYCDACGSQVCAVFGERLAFKPGETIWLQPKVELVHVFDSATGKVLH
jgi:multiple sugar transport system ATP-binding protein